MDAPHGLTARRLLGALAAALTTSALAASAVLAADASVSIANLSFQPPTVTVSVGDSVTWTNQDGVTHTATADGGEFDTGSIGANGSDSVTFATAGTFSYHCSLHSQMTGTVIVQGGTVTPPNTDTVAAERPVGGMMGVLLVVAAWAAGLAVGLRRADRRRLPG